MKRLWARSTRNTELSAPKTHFEGRPPASLTLEDCDFYHYVELADGRVVPGGWDLRGAEDVYLGHQSWAGKRVLELGPATGHLTFWMEAQGAEVVGFDLGPDVRPAVLRPEGPPAEHIQNQMLAAVQRVHNGWWYLHRERKSKARLVHGDIYDLPDDDLGRFDIAVFGSILLHLRDPFAALREASRLTDTTIVVTDVEHEGLGEDDTIVRFDPSKGMAPMGWWGLSPGAVKRMLAILGFPDSTIERHRQRYHDNDDTSRPANDVDLFTIVARRPQ